MVATRKPKTEPTKATPRDRPNAGPTWVSPRTPVPKADILPATKSLQNRAWAAADVNATPEIIAAIIVAQALDRLGDKIIEAAAVGRYHGS